MQGKVCPILLSVQERPSSFFRRELESDILDCQYSKVLSRTICVAMLLVAAIVILTGAVGRMWYVPDSERSARGRRAANIQALLLPSPPQRTSTNTSNLLDGS